MVARWGGLSPTPDGGAALRVGSAEAACVEKCGNIYTRVTRYGMGLNAVNDKRTDIYALGILFREMFNEFRSFVMASFQAFIYLKSFFLILDSFKLNLIDFSVIKFKTKLIKNKITTTQNLISTTKNKW